MRVSLLILALFLLASRADADGYTLKRADSGALLHWRQPRVAIALHESMRDHFPEGRAEEALREAIATWSRAGAGPELVYLGVTEDQPGHRRGASTNGVYLLRPWPYEKNLLAVTVTSFDTRTGEILDADILINGEEEISATGDPSRYDLATILAHEIGHLLGLGEAERNPSATMYPRIARGDRRAIVASAADLEGIRDLYRRAQLAEASSTRLRFASAMGALSLLFGLITLLWGSHRGPLRASARRASRTPSAARAPDDLLELFDPLRRPGREILVSVRGDEHVVLDADPDALISGIAIGALREIEPRLDRDDHARLELSRLLPLMVGADIVHVHAEVMARPVHIERRMTPFGEDLVHAAFE